VATAAKGGLSIEDFRAVGSAPSSYDTALAARLWEVTEALVADKGASAQTTR
jgi:hypothetical protein